MWKGDVMPQFASPWQNVLISASTKIGESECLKKGYVVERSHWRVKVIGCVIGSRDNAEIFAGYITCWRDLFGYLNLGNST